MQRRWPFSAERGWWKRGRIKVKRRLDLHWLLPHLSWTPTSLSEQCNSTPLPFACSPRSSCLREAGSAPMTDMISNWGKCVWSHRHWWLGGIFFPCLCVLSSLSYRCLGKIFAMLTVGDLGGNKTASALEEPLNFWVFPIPSASVL